MTPTGTGFKIGNLSFAAALSLSTQFRKPLTFTQELRDTNWLTSLLRPQFSGGYVRDESQPDQTRGTALINESFRVLINNKFVSVDITYSSNYMVSSGRESKSLDASMQ